MLSAGAAALVIGSCGVGGGDDNADDGATSYQGQTLDLVVPYGPSGGFDVYARAIAPHLGQCLDAEVVVRNEPGAGGLVATNGTAAAASDSSRLQIMNMPGFAATQLADAEGVQFDLRDFSYVGRVAAPPFLVATAPGSEISSFDDVVDAAEPVRFVSQGPGSDESITAGVLAAAYDFPFEVITGYESSDEARAGVIAGDADLHALTADSHRASVDAGDVNGALLTATEPVDYLPDDVPLVTDFPAEGEGQDVLDSLLALSELGRAIAAPPELPDEQLDELQTAFRCAMENDELIKQFDDQQRPVDYGPAGDVEDQLTTVLEESPPSFVTAIEEAF